MKFSTPSRGRHQLHKRRAAPSGIRLTRVEARLVKGMLARGDRAHDVAAYFGVNPGRVAEIATGASFAEVPVAEEQELPPPGPYVRPRELAAVRNALALAQDAVAAAQKLIAH